MVPIFWRIIYYGGEMHMKGGEMVEECRKYWNRPRTSTHRWLSDTSISLAGSPLITWGFTCVTLICPALPIYGCCSGDWLVMDNSSFSRWLGQRTVHSCNGRKNNSINSENFESYFVSLLNRIYHYFHYSFSTFAERWWIAPGAIM